MLGHPFHWERVETKEWVIKRELDRVSLFLSPAKVISKTPVGKTEVFLVLNHELLTVQFVVLIVRIEGHIDTESLRRTFLSSSVRMIVE